MARAAMSVQSIVRGGLAASYGSVASADGIEFTNNGKTFLHVKNSSGGSINVTIQTPGTVDGLAIADRTVAVANGADKFIGPFAQGQYNQSDGVVYVDFSGDMTTSVASLTT